MMHPLRSRRLQFIIFVVVAVGLAVGLASYALKQNINLFFTPSQLLAAPASLQHDLRHDLRIGGLVAKGSFHRLPGSMTASFAVTDTLKTIEVQYTGILPDLFREGQGIVAEGRLNAQGIFIAKQVLAKHDENYMPPQVRDSLQHIQQTRVKAVA